MAPAAPRPGSVRPKHAPATTTPVSEPGTPTSTAAPRADAYITLAQFLKKIQAAGSGGEAKHLARSGAAVVNGEPEARPGRKLREGDRVLIAGTEHLVRLAERPAGA